jgi:hypothetical protein
LLGSLVNFATVLGFTVVPVSIKMHAF